VRGRNSNNELVKEKLGWAPSVKLADGLKNTFEWISSQIKEEVAKGADAEAAFSKSTVCGTMAGPDFLLIMCRVYPYTLAAFSSLA
jgi:GDP-D-mannose 3',5'-epimerase